MVRSETLLIKHMPSVLSNDEKEEFLKYFGAKEVKCIASKHNKYNIAFARFESEDAAENVLHRLHQINVLDGCLSVEFAKNGSLSSDLPKQNLLLGDTKEDKENEKYYNQFIEKLTMWHSSVNFKQPVPCHLKYQYPPPNMQALINIIKVLVTVPKFYTQVLHLMNKMNLPCPFGKDILPDVDLDICSSNCKKKMSRNESEGNKPAEELKESTSESELSSDEELKHQKETIPEDRKIKRKSKIKVSKLLKRMQKPVSVPKTKKTTFEEVFEKPSEEKEPKKIKLSQVMPISDQVTTSREKTAEESSQTGSGFGYIHPVKKALEAEPVKDTRDENEEERLEKEELVFISEKELSENRISEKDRSVLPVFKNYAEGAPTCRLYIKNLAKTVTDSDLRYIYNRYLLTGIEDDPNMFDIRLMQEGRMKGQAFVTLQNVELAMKALKETNGYILKDKPLVVQFARSSTK